MEDISQNLRFYRPTAPECSWDSETDHDRISKDGTQAGNRCRNFQYVKRLWQTLTGSFQWFALNNIILVKKI
jgi:hypothetical protein